MVAVKVYIINNGRDWKSGYLQRRVNYSGAFGYAAQKYNNKTETANLPVSENLIIFAENIRLLDLSAAKELETLARNVELLAMQRDEARKELKAAREEAGDLRRQLGEANEALHKKTLDAEFLTLSHKLARSPQALADARAMVKGMLARVEKAIALLKEDARF